MSDEIEEPLYIRFEIGPQLKYDTNVESLPEAIFWLEVFKERILNAVFNGGLEEILEATPPNLSPPVPASPPPPEEPPGLTPQPLI